MSVRALYPYQREGADWLAATPHAYLADEMRLGKTPQAVEGVNLQFRALRVTVICPAHLRLNWSREIALWAWWPWTATILSYEKAVSDGLPESDVFIFDEAHYLSNPEAKRTKVLLGLRDNNTLDPDHPLRRAAFVWPLSGTPGDPSKFWTWLRVLGRTGLPWIDFTLRYCNTRLTPYGLQVMGVKVSMLPELKVIIGTLFKRRTAADVGLPPARWGTLSLVCGVDNVDTPDVSVDGDGDELPQRDEPLARMMRELGMAKAGPLAAALRAELESGEVPKIVVMAWHRDVLSALEDALADFSPVLVEGGLSERRKQDAQDRFNSDPTCRVFLGQILAAGTGIDLAVACADLVFAELSWNPDDNAQAAKRVQGPKQTRPVMIRVAASENPLDYALSRVNARKSQTVAKTWS